MPAAGESFLSWISQNVGVGNLIILLLAAAISTSLSLFAVYRSKGTTAATMMLVLIPLPFLVAVTFSLKGFTASAMVLSTTTSTVKPDELAGATAMSLATPLAGLLLTLPSYLIVISVMTARAFSHPRVIRKH